MTSAATAADEAIADAKPDFDVVIIGAGSGGIYALYRLRELGFRCRLFEAGTGVGGAWYWNRYPGARFDSESYSYGLSFSPELLQEWSWSEHFAPQPETLRYFNYVADRFDLHKDIQFRSLVTSAHWDGATQTWDIGLEGGAHHNARFVVAAVGPLTVPTFPRIEGRETFKGQAYHTARWPHEPVAFEGKRVAVIGTAATGVQTIQEVAKTAGSLTVFQRTPNFCAPLHNSQISPDEQERIKAGYPAMFEHCRNTFGWFLHTPDPRSTFDVTPEERLAFWEKLYAERGLGIWQGNFRDIMTNPEANRLISEFISNKIRQRVNDPEIAEKLIPKDHGFGTRRVPLETRYFEVYNQPNVELIDLRDTPIERITETGIVTSDREFAFDIIIYATGFDAITGSFDRIDVRGVGGRSLKEKWQGGPSSFVGVHTTDFPNWFMPGGPLAALGNIPRALEYNDDWIVGILTFMRERKLNVVDVKQSAEDDWTDHAKEIGARLLTSNVSSWFTGVNTNIDGKQTRMVVQYRGGVPVYRKRCESEAEQGYPSFTFD